MVHVVRLGIRGVLLEASAALMRVLGPLYYRQLRRKHGKLRVVATEKLPLGN